MKGKLSFLIIEDDKYARLNLREILMPFGPCTEASDVESARKKLSEGFYDIVITDIELGEGSGVDLIGKIVKLGSHCIVVSSYESEETIEKAYTLGARHYLSKFRLKDQLPVYIQKFILAREERFEKILKEEFITQDEELISELRRLTEINWKGQSLFISGPTGTGKSLLGKLIHEITPSVVNARTERESTGFWLIRSLKLRIVFWIKEWSRGNILRIISPSFAGLTFNCDFCT